MVFEKLHMAFFASTEKFDFSFGVCRMPREQARVAWQGVLYLFYNEQCEGLTGALLEYRLDDGRRFRLSREGSGESVLTALDGGREESALVFGERVFGVPLAVFKKAALLSPKEKNACYGARVMEAGRRALAYGREDVDAENAILTLTTIKEQIFGKTEGKGALSALEAEREEAQGACRAALSDSALRLQEENQAIRLQNKIEEAAAEHEKFRRLISDFHESETIAAFDALHEEEAKAEKKANELRLCIKAHTHQGFCPDAGYLFDLISAKNRLEKASVAFSDEEAHIKEISALPPPVTEEERNLLSLLERAGMEKANETATFLTRKKKNSMVLGSLLLAVMATALGFAIGLFAQGNGAFGFMAVVLLLLFAGASAAAWFEAYKAGKRLQALCQYCLANDTEGLALRVREAEDISARIARRCERRFQIESALYRAAESLVLAKEAFASLAAKYGYEAMESSHETVFATLSADVDAYLKEVSSLQAEKELIDNRVRNMRNRLSGIGEVAVRSRLSPPDRARLRKLKESDLLQGAAYYRRQMEELLEKEKRLEVNRYSELSERTAAEYAAKAIAVKEKEAALAARGSAAEEALRIIGEATAALSERAAERKEAASRYFENENEGEALLLGVSLASLERLFLEKPPVFFDGEDGAYTYAAGKWGENGQAFLVV